MTSERVLVVSQHAGAPSLGMAYRPHWLAREWKLAGHDVLVVASSYSHLRRNQPHLNGFSEAQSVDGVDFLWVKGLPYTGNGLRRAAGFQVFAAELVGMRRRIDAFRPSVVIASSTQPFDIRPSAHIARRNHAKFVVEIHDLWPMTPMLLGGYSERHPLMLWMQRQEDFACQNADLVVSILPGTLAHLGDRGLPQDRWRHIPNGVDPGAAVVPLADAAARSIANLRSAFPFLIGYAGGHALSNALSDLLDVSPQLASLGVGIVLVGHGVEKPSLVDKFGHQPNVLFLDPIQQTEVRNFLELVDVAYLGGNDTPLYQFGVSPNKLFEYMYAGVPIVQSIDTESDPVLASGGGMTVSPAAPESLIAAVAAMQRMDRAELSAMGQRSREYVDKHHLQPNLARDFLEAVQEVPSRGH